MGREIGRMGVVTRAPNGDVLAPSVTGVPRAGDRLFPRL